MIVYSIHSHGLVIFSLSKANVVEGASKEYATLTRQKMFSLSHYIQQVLVNFAALFSIQTAVIKHIIRKIKD